MAPGHEVLPASRCPLTTSKDTSRPAAYFEVPLDALPSLRLHLARESLDTRYDVMADVDLGRTAADADDFAGAPPIDMPTPSLGGKRRS